MDDSLIKNLLTMLAVHEHRARHSLNFTPSENTLSPLARLPLILDAYSRYFFDHMKLFGTWSFYGGLELGAIEQDILVPLLQKMSGAQFINVRPISGLNCLTVAMAALCTNGDTMLTVPLDSGGHMSTPVVARRLGIKVKSLTMSNHYDLDLERLADLLKDEQPALIYRDQSTQLFPLDPRPIRDLVDRYSPRTLIHFDGSHVNGLILGGALFNPLDRGANSFGGSTHKTLPGPHKAFLATNERKIAECFDQMADHFVSHHHLAEVVSLAITLIEMKECGGAEYARRVIENAKLFAQGLHERGMEIAATDRGFTECHQVWVALPASNDPVAIANRLFKNGLIVNKLASLPGIESEAFRFSLAEVTRMGAKETEIEALVQVFADVFTRVAHDQEIICRVADIRRRLDQPHYCYSPLQLENLDVPSEVVELCASLVSCVRSNWNY